MHLVIDQRFKVNVWWHHAQVVSLDSQDLQDLVHIDEEADYGNPLLILQIELVQKETS